MAQAQEPATGEPTAPWREVWAGADVGAHVWLLYTGTTLSPYSGIHDEGLKLRVLSGYGGYSYEGLRRGPGKVPALRSFDAETAFTDVLAGYLFRFGPLTAKAFAGVSAINHTIHPFDPENEVQGLDWGAKGVVELWLDVTPEWWASLDTSFTTAHETFASRVRTGYRLQPDLSLGVEAGFNANALDHSARAGLFLRYEWEGGEISASAGVTSGDVGGSQRAQRAMIFPPTRPSTCSSSFDRASRSTDLSRRAAATPPRPRLHRTLNSSFAYPV